MSVPDMGPHGAHCVLGLSYPHCCLAPLSLLALATLASAGPSADTQARSCSGPLLGCSLYLDSFPSQHFAWLLFPSISFISQLCTEFLFWVLWVAHIPATSFRSWRPYPFLGGPSLTTL